MTLKELKEHMRNSKKWECARLQDKRKYFWANGLQQVRFRDGYKKVFLHRYAAEWDNYSLFSCPIYLENIAFDENDMIYDKTWEKYNAGSTGSV